MNIRQATQLPLTDILARLGHQPKHIASNDEPWYLSPFREEQTPSFKLSRDHKAWYDHGTGEGGGVIAFLLKFYRTESVSEALRALTRLYPGSLFEAVAPSPQPATPLPLFEAAPSTPVMEQPRVETLKNRALIGYLSGERAIPYQTARPYVQEIHYSLRGKPYFALAFANDSGGHELRNRYYQGAYGTKDITLLHGERAPRGVAVFEGFMDFLSALTYGELHDNPAVLVLNSTAMLPRAIQTIRERNIGRIALYLDRDPAGREATQALQDALAELDVTDQSVLYDGHKDFNDFLREQKQQANSR